MASIPGSVGRPAAPTVRLSLGDPVVRSIIYQVLVVGFVVLLVGYLVHNTVANLEARKIASGFGFLGREAGFGISQSLIEYAPTNTYARAIFDGILNTLLVAAIGI